MAIHLTPAASLAGCHSASHLKECLVSRDRISRIDFDHADRPATDAAVGRPIADDRLDYGEAMSQALGAVELPIDQALDHLLAPVSRPFGIHSSSDFDLCLQILDGAIERALGPKGHPAGDVQRVHLQAGWLIDPYQDEGPGQRIAWPGWFDAEPINEDSLDAGPADAGPIDAGPIDRSRD